MLPKDKSKIEEYKRVLSEQKKGDLNPAKRQEVREKISLRTSEAMYRPEVQKKLRVPMKEETKAKLRGKIVTSDTRKRISDSHKGKKLKKESIEKRTENRRKNGWNKDPEKTKIIRSLALKGKTKGRVQSEEEKRKRSISNTKYFENNPEKREFYSKLYSLEKHPQWKGGISFEEYPCEFSRQLKEEIRNRDERKCRICNVEECKIRGKLHIHHIDYNKKNNNTNNLVSLCINCHMKTNHRREYWKEFFHKMMNFA